jgi:zinc transporter ZupT
MVAASFWSLLAPVIEMTAGEGFSKVMPAAIGFFLVRCLFLVLIKCYLIFTLILK